MSTMSQFFGGSGGGLPPIDSAVMLNRTDDVATIDTAVFLRSGVIETDVTVYPDAFEVPGGYNLSVSSYSGTLLALSSQTTSPSAVAFSTDGTKLFVAGALEARVYQYTLSTAFVISTASYSGNIFSVGPQDSFPQGLAFSPDGTKMFVLGDTTNTLYEYTLGTAFSISTASYSGNSLSVGAQDGTPNGLAFSPNGTKMFILGDSTNKIYEYTLGTAFSISTASYSGLSLTFNQETTPTGLAFNPDGTKLFIVGYIQDTVFEYTLSTAFSIMTASYTGHSLYVGSQDNFSQGLAFSPDGTKMFVLGDTTNTLYEYTSPAAFSGTSVAYTEGRTNQYVRVA